MTHPAHGAQCIPVFLKPGVPMTPQHPWCPRHQCAHGAQGIPVPMVPRASMCAWCAGPTCAHGAQGLHVPMAFMCPLCPGHPCAHGAQGILVPTVPKYVSYLFVQFPQWTRTGTLLWTAEPLPLCCLPLWRGTKMADLKKNNFHDSPGVTLSSSESSDSLPRDIVAERRWAQFKFKLMKLTTLH